MENTEKRLYVIEVHGKVVETFTKYGQAIECFYYLCKSAEETVSKKKTVLKQYFFNNEMTLEEHKNYHTNEPYSVYDSSLKISKLWTNSTNKFTYVIHSLPITKVELLREKEYLSNEKFDRDNDFYKRECWYVDLYGKVTYYPCDEYTVTELFGNDRETTELCRVNL